MTNDDSQTAPEERTREHDDRPVRETVKDIDHTHPHTGEPFGAAGVYDRGPEQSGTDRATTGDQPIPDGGGSTGGAPRRLSGQGDPDDRRRVRDRDHRPPDGIETQRVFDRGGERHRDGT